MGTSPLSGDPREQVDCVKSRIEHPMFFAENHHRKRMKIPFFVGQIEWKSHEITNLLGHILSNPIECARQLEKNHGSKTADAEASLLPVKSWASHTDCELLAAPGQGSAATMGISGGPFSKIVTPKKTVKQQIEFDNTNVVILCFFLLWATIAHIIGNIHIYIYT